MCTRIFTPAARLLLHVKPPQDFRVSLLPGRLFYPGVCQAGLSTILVIYFLIGKITNSSFTDPEIHWKWVLYMGK